MSDTNNNSSEFKEEQDNLVHVEKRIKRISQAAEDEVKKYEAELDGFMIFDYDDHARMITMKKDLNNYNRQVDEYHQIMDSPYFGHFDMAEDEGPLQTFYVGKEALMDPVTAELIIIDWRTPMGNTYYNKNQKSFTVHGIKYELMLRRAVDISNGSLKAVKTEYDAYNLSLEGDIIDEFLISVLKDKRRNNKLTDIIRTIQGNQNDIIRKPLDENFVVQGCAGSGKTMILLHRLSYIAFNYPGMNFERVFILTPNENFNLQINELSESLGLDKINRMTVGAFYAYMIRTIAGTDSVVVNNKRVLKINVSANDLKSEKLLNQELLKRVYSQDYYNELISEYHIHAKEAAETIKRSGVLDLTNSRGFNVISFEEINYKVFSTLINALTGIKNNNNKVIDQMKDAEERLIAVKKRLEKLKKKIVTDEMNLKSAREMLHSELVSKIYELKNKSTEYRELLDFREVELRDLTTKREILTSQINDIESTLNLISEEYDNLCDYDYIVATSNSATELVKQRCASVIQELMDLHAQLESLAFYNFAKKRRINDAIKVKYEEYVSSVKATIEEYRVEKTLEVDVYKNENISPLDKTISDINIQIRQLTNEDKALSSKIEVYQACRALLDKESYPNILESLNASYLYHVEDDVIEYDNVFKSYMKTKTELDSSNDTEELLLAEIENCKKSLLTQDEVDEIDEALSEVKKFDARSIDEEWETKLKDLYKQYKQRYSTKQVYRHKLYLKMLLCSLYYEPINYSTYLNIDEAQDFAYTEFMVLKDVLGSKAVFNLYGDVNQSIYEYKGISDWDILQDITENNIYLLNENYRNTTQITEFCNEEFDADITAIGLTGEDVVRTDFDDAIKRLRGIVKDDPDTKAAIIYRRGLEGLDFALKKQNLSCSFNSISEYGISVITVEEAKGLEFGAVVVVDNYMTLNEQYVSNTRALDNLIITTLVNASFSDGEAIVE